MPENWPAAGWWSYLAEFGLQVPQVPPFLQYAQDRQFLHAVQGFVPKHVA